MNAPPTIPGDEYTLRLERLHALMDEKTLDGVVVFGAFKDRDGHLAYLSNHRITWPPSLSHCGIGYGALVFPLGGNGTLTSPLVCDRERLFNVNSVKTGSRLVPDIVAAVKENGLSRGKVGLVGLDIVTMECHGELSALLPGVSFVPADELLEEMRRIKSESEIALLRQAALVGSEAVRAGIAAACVGKTTHHVEMTARETAMSSGADCVARVSVCCGGGVPLAIWPMNALQNINDGELVYVSVEGWAGGYGFECARVKTAGDSSDEQQDFREHLNQAADWMFERLYPGAQLSWVLTLHRNRRIDPFGYGIGLEIGEPPWMTIGREKVSIAPNMVVCIKPAVVDNALGTVSLSEMVLVTETGAEILTTCPRNEL